MADDNLARGFTRLPAPTEPQSDVAGSSDILINPENTEIGVETGDGTVRVVSGDGSSVIEFNPRNKTSRQPDKSDFGHNLADDLDSSTLTSIANDLLTKIENDDRSRQDWLETRAKGIEMLGLKIEEPRGDTGSSTAPVEGMAVVRHPSLLEAITRFQANAGAELLPAEGPVKVRNDSPPMPQQTADQLHGAAAGSKPAVADNDDLANALEKDFNHYLTVVDKGYRSDTDRMLFWVGFGGCGFKKVYNDPIRRMPISRAVDAADLIVNDAANDLDDAGRVTHRIKMRKSTLIRMQIAGVYRKYEIRTPQNTPQNPVELQLSEQTGFSVQQPLPGDEEHTIYECYVEYDIPGLEHLDEDGNASGLALPYRISIDKDSRDILEIRRNWREDDPNCLSRKVFVKYPFNTAYGFYDIGLLHLLGNTNRALTAIWRIAIDGGMFSNFPGFLYSAALTRQLTNEFRIPPGGGMPLQITGNDIRSAVMPVPYKEPGPSLFNLAKMIEDASQRIGGTAENTVAEGRQDAPVGTTLAMIEQATKLMAAVHVRLHAAQSEEFQLLKERFREDPESFWRYNNRPAVPWQVEQFLEALENYDVVPAADPNTPSHMHRIMTAVAVKQLQAVSPQLYDARAVDSRILRMIGISDVDSLFNTPEQMAAMQQQGPPPIDQAKMAQVQLKQQQMQMEQQGRSQERLDQQTEQLAQQRSKAQQAVVESQDRAADRESRERVSQQRTNVEIAKLVGDMVNQGVIDPHTGMLWLQSLSSPTQPAPGLIGQPVHTMPRVI